MSLWPSIGPAVHGFEFKSSRGDWRRELRQEGKADMVGRFCTHWWLVTPTLEIARETELPEGWGWLSGERPARAVREQRSLERAVHKDQLDFGWELPEGSGPVVVEPAWPEPVYRDPKLLWTVRPATQRAAPPPDWLLCASLLRRAQAEAGGQRLSLAGAQANY